MTIHILTKTPYLNILFSIYTSDITDRNYRNFEGSNGNHDTKH